MMCFIRSGFWCQSAVWRKLADNTKTSEFRAVLAKAMTLAGSPSSIKHLREVFLSPTFRYKFEAISKLPCFLHFSATVFIRSFLLLFYIALLGSSSGMIFLMRSYWMGTFCWTQTSNALSYCLELISRGTALSNLLCSSNDAILALIASLSPPSIKSSSSAESSSAVAFVISSVNPCFSAKKFPFFIAPALI